MTKTRVLITAALGVAAVTALVVGSAGGQSPGGQPDLAADQASLDHSLKNCQEEVDEFTDGQSVEGLDRVHREVVCTQPEPVRTQTAGGIDPTSLGRGNFVASIYGSCKATSDQGCAPPLQIQTWPACERSAADYTVEGRRLQPSEVLSIRGVPARFYGDDRLEVSTGDVTVVIFSDNRALALAAARALRTTPSSPDGVGPSANLPAPVSGSEGGTLPC